MAIDAALFEFGLQTGQALWRAYGWTEPAVTFGYSQRWGWIQAQLPGFAGAMIRRMTGGGIVDHRNDLTYALSIPAIHPFYRSPALHVYREVHQRIAAILLDHGFRAGLAACDRQCGDSEPALPSGICFQAPEPCDVIDTLTGTKLAGAAMKRNRNGVLIQGSLSLQGLPGLSREEFVSCLNTELRNMLHAEPVGFAGQLPREWLVRERERFSSPAWNHKR